MKNVIALAAATGIAVALAASTPAEARHRGGAVAAGIVGGLAIGALIGAAASQPAYGYAPGPVYYYEPYPRCYWQRELVWDGFAWRRTRVRVCY